MVQVMHHTHLSKGKHRIHEEDKPTDRIIQLRILRCDRSMHRIMGRHKQPRIQKHLPPKAQKLHPTRKLRQIQPK